MGKDVGEVCWRLELLDNVLGRANVGDVDLLNLDLGCRCFDGLSNESRG